MRGIGVTLLLLIISVKILRPQSQSRQEIVVPAATPLAAESTPARLPVGTLKAHPTEITVPAANSSAAQATALPTEKATKPDASEIREAKQSDTISKDEVMALAKRIQEQQIQIETNQAEIDEQAYDIFVMVDEAFIFSRRASK